MLMTDIENNSRAIDNYLRGRIAYSVCAIYEDKMFNTEFDRAKGDIEWHITVCNVKYVDEHGNVAFLIKWFYKALFIEIMKVK